MKSKKVLKEYGDPSRYSTSQARALTQKEFNSVYDMRHREQLHGSISTRDKWNLKMDIKDLKQELKDLQNTAAHLPDPYVAELCDTESYPFDDVIDDDRELNDWCDEMDAFLADSLNMPDRNYLYK